jgi:hypothetical protein
MIGTINGDVEMLDKLIFERMSQQENSKVDGNE